MQRDLLLLLLGAAFIEPFAFDDDDDGGDDDASDDDEDGDDSDDDDDSSSESKKKDEGKKKDDGKSEKKSKSDTPEALKKQVTDLQRKLSEKNKRIATLSRERASLRRNVDTNRKSKTDSDDDDGDDSETAQLRQTVADLTDRLDNISSENFIEKNVIRKLQPLVAAGLDDDEADRKLNAALRLVDSDEDFDDDGNFDAEGFLKRYPYLAVEAESKEEANRDRLLGGSGKKNKSKKDYASEALTRFNGARDRKAAKA